MNAEVEAAIKEYYELNEKIKELERRKSELKEVLHSVFDSEHMNDLYAENIHIYRMNRPRISWDESVLKSILVPKGLWESVVAVDNKKVRDLIGSGVLSESDVEKAKKAVDTWYTYTERVSKHPDITSNAPPSNEGIKGIKKLVITDLSRMKDGRVCIFGFDEEKRHVRPVIPYSGINESYIFNEEGRQIIKPFAEVEFDFIRPWPDPPHIEDCVIRSNYKPTLVGNLSENESRRFLEEILDGSVAAIFVVPIQDNRCIKIGGKRSIGTIKVKEVLYVNYSLKNIDKYNYRIKFSDLSGEVYNLPITDCAFRRYCDTQRIQEDKTTDSISHELQRIFNESEVFLRVGLTRRYQDVYWLQVSGIYAFPDYKEKNYRKYVGLESGYPALREMAHEDNYDNRQETKETIDGTLIAQKILSCLLEVNEKFGKNHIADILCGSKSQKIIRNHHDTLTTYGAGKEYSRDQWQDFITELVKLDYLKSEGGVYPIIRITQKGYDILSGKEKIFLTKPSEERWISDENFDCDLFEILRNLRKELADAEGMPPYIIFHDSSLKAMATHFPRSLSDFRQISGVGESKLEKYGELFLEEIISYRKDNMIEQKVISEPFDKQNKDTLENINFKHATSYHVVEQPEPLPQNRKLGQQERRQLIITLIKENQIENGASIQKVVSEATKKGIDYEQVLSDIQHLKREGRIMNLNWEK